MGGATASMDSGARLLLNRKHLKTPKVCEKMCFGDRSLYTRTLNEYNELLTKKKKGIKLDWYEEKRIKQLERDGLYSRLMVAEGIEDVTTHEMGHYFHHFGKNLPANPWGEGFEYHIYNIAESCMKEKKWLWKVSSYADTDPYEFIAESFCCYHRGEFGSIHSNLLKIFDKFFGRKI